MRLAAIACCAALAVALAAPLHAETVAVTQLVNVPGNSSVNVQLMCPEEFEILAEARAYTARRPAGIEHTEIHFVGRQGNLLPLEDAAGQEMQVRNALAAGTDVSLTMLCAKREGLPVVATANLGPLGSTVLFGQCPDGKAPVGAAANLDETALRTSYKLFKYGNKYLDQLPDGNATGAPTEIELFASNALQYVQSLRMAVRCVDAANLETIVQSVATTPGSAFTMFVPIPDGYDFVGMTSAAGTNSAFTLTHLWLADGSVSTLPPHGDHEGRVKGVFVDGVDTRTGPAKYSERAYVGVVVRRTGSAQPQPVVVQVVEFHHAALDHYFITANAKEIADLDSGVHPGWVRTGKSFQAYAVGSSGNAGRRPVCRAYGNPAAGLDSHFYSASPQECVATVTNFNGAWLLEASEVFEMELPNASTGECASGGVAIYRVWNNRADSNHRYTTSLADRDAMVAKGYVKEGYGPQSVTLCAVP